MMLLTAAAAAVLVSRSGDSAEIRVMLDPQDRPAARRAIRAAAWEVCDALSSGYDDHSACVLDVRRRALRELDRRPGLAPGRVAAKR